MKGRRPNYAWVDLDDTQRLARFLARTQLMSTGCREWMGKRFRNGYGQVCLSLEPKKRTYFLAHRLAWSIAFGDPGKLQVLHHCDNPPCVNIDHLFLGTAKDNANDMLSKGRGNPAKGERSGKAKLTADAVRAIRSAALSGATHRSIADQYGVSTKQVTVIINNQQWTHVK